MTTPASTTPAKPGGFGGVIDTVSQFAKIPGIGNLSGLLSGASLPIGGSSATSSAESSSTSGIGGDVNIAGIGSSAGTPSNTFMYIVLGVAGFFLWKKYG